MTECPTLTETPGPLQVVARDAVAVVAAVRVDTQLMTRVSAVEAFVKICTQSPTHTNDDFKIQDYFIISSEKLNTWLKIYHILHILKLKEQLLKIHVI